MRRLGDALAIWMLAGGWAILVLILFAGMLWLADGLGLP